MVRTQIDIPTAQNVIISYPLANFGERFMAMLIDLIAVGTFISFMIGGIAILLDNLDVRSEMVMMIVGLMPIFLTLAYFTCFEMLNKGRTIGKMAASIQIMKTDGGDLRWSEVFLRSLCLLPDLVFSLGTVGAILINTTPRRQRLGDIAGSTVVVKSAGNTNQIWLRDLLSIQTLSDYTPKYPQVRKLTEKDMVFIKSVILRYEQNNNRASLNAVIELGSHLQTVLEIETVHSGDWADFLRTLLRDYVVLTR